MSETDNEDVRGQTAAQIESTPQGIVRRWLSELEMAHRSDKEWVEESKEIWRTYKAGKSKPNAFNVLWSNTDTLAPAVYNSLPVPDVRRRFRDADPIGKAASQVIERTLAFEIDQFDADKVAKDAVLDMLICGRGTIRVRYQPTFAPMKGQADGAQTAEPAEPTKLLDEIVPWEHVQWDDFRRGPGKRWDDVPWVAFRHQFSREMAEKDFGPEVAAKLEYLDAENSKDGFEKDERRVFQTTEVWEIWDKDQRRVLFIAKCYKDGPCKELTDPLNLQSFFPVPRPAMAVEQSDSLVPIPLYRLYKEQAKELDRVSARINKIVDALKVRGAYMANQQDIERVLDAADNQMIPIQNLSGVSELGGLDKAVWIMPIDKLIAVLQGLYVARTEIKSTIYEITGISDIVRGSTAPSESATAQKLKSEWGTMRLQKMQKEVQRMLRDAMRLQAELYAERYDMVRFSKITGIQLPTMQQKMKLQQQMMLQQQALAQNPQAAGPPQQQAPMTAPQGQPPNPALDMLRLPTWEEVIGLLRADGLRQCRIDIETDSTVADVVNKDMMGLAEVTEAMGQLIAGAAPAVQSGMMPVDVVKEIALTISRRARFGLAVEDAIDKIQQPPPQMPPEQMKQIEQGQKDLEAGKQEIEKGKAEVVQQQLAVHDQHRSMLEQAMKILQSQAQNAMGEADTHRARADEATAMIAERGPADKAFEKLVMQLLEAQAQTQQAVMQSSQEVKESLDASAKVAQSQAEAIMTSMQVTQQALADAVAAITAPRHVSVKLPSGKTASAVSVVKH